MITFNPLWRTLQARSLNKTELQKLTGLSSATIAKFSKNKAADSVMLEVVDRICKALAVPIYDVVESVADEE